MIEEVEISSLDLRYESCRMKNPNAEKALLASILERGVRDPLQGANTKDGQILLNGFKRYRCCKKLAIEIVPYCRLGDDEVSGLIELIRMSNCKCLTIIEQARLIDELRRVHKMSISRIADHLEKSKGWVSMRCGMIAEISDFVKEKIFKAEFPAYSYMYTLRRFMRMNGVSKQQIERFVGAVCGHRLSIREIELLAYGYFNGTEEFRLQIQEGNISWGLSSLKERLPEPKGCTKLEQQMLKELEITQRYMHRMIYASRDSRLKSRSFYAQANVLAGGILKQMEKFSTAIQEFYDKSR